MWSKITNNNTIRSQVLDEIYLYVAEPRLRKSPVGLRNHFPANLRASKLKDHKIARSPIFKKQNREIFCGNFSMRFLKRYRPTQWLAYGSSSALFTFYFGIASQSAMTLVCLSVSSRAKLRCRRRLGSFLSKPLPFLQHYRTLYEKTDKIYNNGVLWESPLPRWLWYSMNGLGPIGNDGHAQRKSQASHALARGTTVSRWIWCLPGA